MFVVEVDKMFAAVFWLLSLSATVRSRSMKTLPSWSSMLLWSFNVTNSIIINISFDHIWHDFKPVKLLHQVQQQQQQQQHHQQRHQQQQQQQQQVSCLSPPSCFHQQHLKPPLLIHNPSSHLLATIGVETFKALEVFGWRKTKKQFGCSWLTEKSFSQSPYDQITPEETISQSRPRPLSQCSEVLIVRVLGPQQNICF